MRRRVALLLVAGSLAGAWAQPTRLKALQAAALQRDLEAIHPTLRKDTPGAWMRGFEWNTSGPGRSPKVGILIEENPNVAYEWVERAVHRTSLYRRPRCRLLVGNAAGLQGESLDVCLIPLSSRSLAPGSCAVPNPIQSTLEVVEVRLPPNSSADLHVVMGEVVLSLESQLFDGVEDSRMTLEKFTPQGAQFSLKSFDQAGRQRSLDLLRQILNQQIPGPGKAQIVLQPQTTVLPASFPRRVRQALSKLYGQERISSEAPYEDEVRPHQPTWLALQVPVVKVWLAHRATESPAMLEAALRELLR